MALYENETLEPLKNNFSQHKYSLKYLLEEIRAKKIKLKNEYVLKSVDTKEDYLAALQSIKHQSF